MAARRLLIVMLVLLGLSTLAAALVPQHAPRGGTTASTTTEPATTTTPSPPIGRSLTVEILVGGKKVPVVAAPLCKARKVRCEPLHVGDQLSLQVLSKTQAELEIPALGLLGVATSNSPAFFQLLPREPGTIGVLFTTSREVAARVQVLSAKAAAKAIQKPKGKSKSKSRSKPEAKPRARGGSGPP
jgi:hypothetical protein